MNNTDRCLFFLFYFFQTDAYGEVQISHRGNRSMEGYNPWTGMAARGQIPDIISDEKILYHLEYRNPQLQNCEFKSYWHH